jgi:hypothetical protein
MRRGRWFAGNGQTRDTRRSKYYAGRLTADLTPGVTFRQQMPSWHTIADCDAAHTRGVNRRSQASQFALEAH